MKNKLDKIYESKIVHNSFLDKDSVIDAMTESYILGLNESEQKYLKTAKKYFIDNLEMDDNILRCGPKYFLYVYDSLYPNRGKQKNDLNWHLIN